MALCTSEQKFDHKQTKYPETRKRLEKNERMNESANENANESESYHVATYIGILSFLWGVPYRPVRSLIGGTVFWTYSF